MALDLYANEPSSQYFMINRFESNSSPKTGVICPKKHINDEYLFKWYLENNGEQKTCCIFLCENC